MKIDFDIERDPWVRLRASHKGLHIVGPWKPDKDKALKAVQYALKNQHSFSTAFTGKKWLHTNGTWVMSDDQPVKPNTKTTRGAKLEKAILEYEL